VATFVLVHPAWFGGWCWGRITAPLREQGHDVFTPTLTGLGERAHLAGPDVGLDTHVQDVAAVLELEQLEEVVLVGHSSSGIVITGVADRVPGRIASLVYLDAFVPEAGRSVLDLLPPGRRPALEELVETEGDGWALPRFAAPAWEQFVPETWDVHDEADLSWVLPRLRPTPFRHFSDPLSLGNASASSFERIYVRCPGYPHPGFDRYAENARSLRGWAAYELPANHLPFVTHPRELAELLGTIAGTEAAPA
jgi:pimeloyl-ACP methyl ester carboxylesterase